MDICLVSKRSIFCFFSEFLFFSTILSLFLIQDLRHFKRGYLVRSVTLYDIPNHCCCCEKRKREKKYKNKNCFGNLSYNIYRTLKSLLIGGIFVCFSVRTWVPFVIYLKVWRLNNEVVSSIQEN